MRTVPVFYDFVCPYAFVAHARVRNLWKELPLRFEWVPWEIYPETPREGVPRSAEWQVLEPLAKALFEEQNLAFQPTPLLPNTNLALRAALWAERAGGGEDFRDSVFRRYYEQGRDITHPDVLAGLIERVGLDPIAFLDDIKGGGMHEELRESDLRAEEAGVRWAPAFVVGKSCIVGDVPWTVLDEALKTFAAEPG